MVAPDAALSDALKLLVDGSLHQASRGGWARQPLSRQSRSASAQRVVQCCFRLRRVQMEPLAQAALERGDWETAQSIFERVLRDSPEDADALDGLGTALFWLNQLDAAVRHRERAYAIYVREGNLGRAAWIARRLAMAYWLAYQNRAASDADLRFAEQVDGPGDQGRKGYGVAVRAGPCPSRADGWTLVDDVLDAGFV
jgi:tetratricopeptide (TPR) repeat protein